MRRFLTDMIGQMTRHIASEMAARERRRGAEVASLSALIKQRRGPSPPRRRRPPEAGLAVPAVPPRGPLPLQGGAEAPLDFTR